MGLDLKVIIGSCFCDFLKIPNLFMIFSEVMSLETLTFTIKFFGKAQNFEAFTKI
jgi:hypothetical protein